MNYSISLNEGGLDKKEAKVLKRKLKDIFAKHGKGEITDILDVIGVVNVKDIDEAVAVDIRKLPQVKAVEPEGPAPGIL